MNVWHVVTLGHLSRNCFWGESDYEGYHSVLATSTVIQTEKYGNILVDPSMPGTGLQKAVYDNTGLHPEQINTIYCTHLHNDHWMGLEAFPDAKVYMAKKDLETLLGLKKYLASEQIPQIERVLPADGELFPGFELIPLPGHTEGIQGLLFEGPEGKVLCTGDAVMGFEYCRARRGYFFGWSAEESARSVEKAVGLADVIIPGHGNSFLAKAYPFDADAYKEEPDRYRLIQPGGPITAKSPFKMLFSVPGWTEILEKFWNLRENIYHHTCADFMIGVMAESCALPAEQLEAFLREINRLVIQK